MKIKSLKHLALYGNIYIIKDNNTIHNTQYIILIFKNIIASTAMVLTLVIGSAILTLNTSRLKRTLA